MFGFVQKLSLGVAITALAAAASTPALSAPPSDWSQVPAKTVKLFYPGQSSYQWLRSPAHKRADRKTKAGDSCVSCHEGEEVEMGQKIVTGKKLEPHPIAGKQATIDLAVQAAHDDQNLYLRFQWKTRNDFPGSAYPHFRFDGKAWKSYGWPRLDEKVWKDNKPAIYEDRLTIMLDDDKVPGFKNQGCWLTCHDGMRDMPKFAEVKAVSEHPLLGKALKKKDVRKYLPETRTDDMASWDKTKSAEEIAKLKAAGHFVELMQWRAHRSNVANMADDGYVLEYRLFDQGKNPFAANWDKDKKQPKFMYDAKKVGFKSRTMADLRDQSKPAALTPELAAPFDPNAGWKEGDLIPRYTVTPKNASGSAADNNDVKGTWKNGMWTVVWTRKFNTGHPADDKILKPGGVYDVGFAVHDDNITTRGHHVSFPVTVGIGAKATITAVTVK